MFHVLLTSSRIWHEPQVIRAAFLQINERVEDKIELTHGDCPEGGDRMGAALAAELGWAVDPMAADWDNCAPSCPRPIGHRKTKRASDKVHIGALDDFCPAAGPRRNRLMVAKIQPFKDKALCVAFSRGVSFGTNQCAGLAERAGIKTIRYRM